PFVIRRSSVKRAKLRWSRRGRYAAHGSELVMRRFVVFAVAAALSCVLSGCLTSGDALLSGAHRSTDVPLDGQITTAPPGSCHYHDGLPDPVCTPGDRDNRVTQDNIASTICAPGWSKRVRP